jgi:hypothetical protein
VKLIKYRSSISSGNGDLPSSLPFEAVPAEFRSEAVVDAVVDETGLNDRSFFASNVMLPSEEKVDMARSNFETDMELGEEVETLEP